MYTYIYDNISTSPDLEALDNTIKNAINKEFLGTSYNGCNHCQEGSCQHLCANGHYHDNLSVHFNFEISTSEKSTLDGIIENNL